MSHNAVTGAYDFSGRHIAAALLARGDGVLNLTNHPDRPDPFGGRVPVAPLAFADPDALAASLAGADTLYNTYWVRFAHGGVTHADAVRNSAPSFMPAACRVCPQGVLVCVLLDDGPRRGHAGRTDGYLTDACHATRGPRLRCR